MKKLWKKVVTFALALSMAVTPAVSVFADGTEDSYGSGASSDVYVSFGADLNSEQKATVMELLGVTEADLENYTVGTITNEMEHEALDAYLSKEVIGKRAFSSVKVTLKEKGNGINVETHNINYCTAGMYTNALITAGIQDADVVVAGPYDISGTAALIGTMNAYSAMTGEEVPEANFDTAVDELVTTGELAELIGDKEDAEKLVALIKEKIASGDLETEEDINEAIDEAAEELNVTLTEEDRQMILDLMKKISELDLDLDTLLSQAQDVYGQLEALGLTTEQATGFLADISKTINTIVEWFHSIFG